MVTSRLNNCWWVHEPLEDWENLTLLRYSGCYRMEWRTPKTLLPHRSRLEDVVHELYEMKLLLKTGKPYASCCLPSMLSVLQSHRYSLSLKSWCIAQLVFVGGQQFLYVIYSRGISHGGHLCMPSSFLRLLCSCCLDSISYSAILT